MFTIVLLHCVDKPTRFYWSYVDTAMFYEDAALEYTVPKAAAYHTAAYRRHHVVFYANRPARTPTRHVFGEKQRNRITVQPDCVVTEDTR